MHTYSHTFIYTCTHNMLTQYVCIYAHTYICTHNINAHIFSHIDAYMHTDTQTHILPFLLLSRTQGNRPQGCLQENLRECALMGLPLRFLPDILLSTCVPKHQRKVILYATYDPMCRLHQLFVLHKTLQWQQHSGDGKQFQEP